MLVRQLPTECLRTAPQRVSGITAWIPKEGIQGAITLNTGTPSPRDSHVLAPCIPGDWLCVIWLISFRGGDLGKGQDPPYPREAWSAPSPPKPLHPHPSPLPLHGKSFHGAGSESCRNNGGTRKVTVGSQHATVVPLLSLAWGWQVVVGDLLCSLCSSSEFLCAVNPDFTFSLC